MFFKKNFYITVYFWINEFKRGWTSTKNEVRPGPPVKANAPEIIEKIYRIIMEDRRIKVREIAQIIESSVRAVHNILQKKNVCLMGAAIVDHRPNARKNISEQCLIMLKRIVQDFWHRFVFVDETWIHHYTPETKQQPKHTENSMSLW